MTDTFTFKGQLYERFHERCPKCKRPLAYHGLDSDTKACVSCPKCAAGKTFNLPLLSKQAHPEVERSSERPGRPRLLLTSAERKERLREQWRQARRRSFRKSSKTTGSVS